MNAESGHVIGYTESDAMAKFNSLQRRHPDKIYTVQRVVPPNNLSPGDIHSRAGFSVYYTAITLDKNQSSGDYYEDQYQPSYSARPLSWINEEEEAEDEEYERIAGKADEVVSRVEKRARKSLARLYTAEKIEKLLKKAKTDSDKDCYKVVLSYRESFNEACDDILSTDIDSLHDLDSCRSELTKVNQSIDDMVAYPDRRAKLREQKEMLSNKIDQLEAKQDVERKQLEAKQRLEGYESKYIAYSAEISRTYKTLIIAIICLAITVALKLSGDTVLFILSGVAAGYSFLKYILYSSDYKINKANAEYYKILSSGKIDDIRAAISNTTDSNKITELYNRLEELKANS